MMKGNFNNKIIGSLLLLFICVDICQGEVEIQQKKALKALRTSRDKKKWEKALSAMQSAAETEENLMPYIVTAAKAFATTGEISNTFREVFGEYRPKEVF